MAIAYNPLTESLDGGVETENTEAWSVVRSRSATAWAQNGRGSDRLNNTRSRLASVEELPRIPYLSQSISDDAHFFETFKGHWISPSIRKTRKFSLVEQHLFLGALSFSLSHPVVVLAFEIAVRSTASALSTQPLLSLHHEYVPLIPNCLVILRAHTLVLGAGQNTTLDYESAPISGSGLPTYEPNKPEKAGLSDPISVEVAIDNQDERIPTEEELLTLRRVPAAMPWAAFAICLVEFAERACKLIFPCFLPVLALH